MDIDREIEAAQKRIKQSIDKSVRRTRRSINKIFFANPLRPIAHDIILTVRDREHFYKLVNWCNINLGKGGGYWVVKGKVLKFVDPSKKSYNPPAIKRWIIYTYGVDISPLFSL